MQIGNSQRTFQKRSNAQIGRRRYLHDSTEAIILTTIPGDYLEIAVVSAKRLPGDAFGHSIVVPKRDNARYVQCCLP